MIIRGNRVSGSGGEGLGIEIWGGCPRSLIEDNVIDHWLSVDGGTQSAVRRNVIGSDDGTLKVLRDRNHRPRFVVTDNLVQGGASIGLSVSNRPVKNNVYWGYNTVRDCEQWGAQFQGESGGIAHHYFHHCVFENTLRGDAKARIPKTAAMAFAPTAAAGDWSSRIASFRATAAMACNSADGRRLSGVPPLDDQRQRTGRRQRARAIYGPGVPRLQG